MKKSTHRVEIIELNPFKHPNADSLVIQQVFGYQVVLRTQDWEGKKYGAYLVPDTVVDTEREEFSWLSPKVTQRFSPAKGSDDTRYHRVTTMRLRGVLSYGLMVEAPEGFRPGDDASEYFQTERYQPTLIATGSTLPPDRYTHDYDIEALERYGDEIFSPGEQVVCFEKLDGMNSRFCVQNGELHAGSKTIWLDKVTGADSSVWKVPAKYPQLLKLLEENPDCTVYGEIIGYPHEHKTKLRYGIAPGEIDFYFFDILKGTEFLGYHDLLAYSERYGLKLAPMLCFASYDLQVLKDLAGGISMIPEAKHKREGIVVRPLTEQRKLVGRAVLKLVSWG